MKQPSGEFELLPADGNLCEAGAARVTFLLSLTKWYMNTIVGLLMGHCSINYHMEKDLVGGFGYTQPMLGGRDGLAFHMQLRGILRSQTKTPR